MNNEKKIIGVFRSEQEAVKAIESLKIQGYTSDEISIIARNKDDVSAVADQTGTKAPEGLATGAATGGLLGGAAGLLAGLGLLAIPGIGPILAAGPIAAALTGAAVGAGAGGLVGGLIGLGIPEDEARQYNNYVDEGNILVLVDSNATLDNHAYNTFRENNSLNSSTYDNTANTTGNRYL
ncbi:general stress protein [Paenibacillus agricola]|uniref:Low temperature-induced protein n=1 Tax=Paenibacillus agricola TaxID=2716264 RepID=A0ABX0JCP8_9BACL|nr:general stress protein [Paenibacillus agricola]NHN33932.1 low temperature-induced protein [Paenibacillus agricola]